MRVFQKTSTVNNGRQRLQSRSGCIVVGILSDHSDWSIKIGNSSGVFAEDLPSMART